MNIFGIVKYRRVRKGTSKAGKEYVNYDYIIESINTDSPQSFAFTAGETMNARLKEQGMRDGALGDIFLHTEASVWQGKEGDIDVNKIYPTRFRPYKGDRGGAAQPAGEDAGHKEEEVKSGDLPF